MKPRGGARKPTQGKKPRGGDKKPTIEVKKPEMTDGGRRKKPSPTKPDTGGGGIVGNYPSLPKKENNMKPVGHKSGPFGGDKKPEYKRKIT